MGEKFSKVGFEALLHTKHVCRFRGDLLRDSLDPLSRKKHKPQDG